MLEPVFVVGSSTITKVPELNLNGFTASQLLVGFEPSLLDLHPEWMDERTYDTKSGRVFMSVHSWLVRHEGKTILIDTGAGNDKERPLLRVLDHLHNPYVARLGALGIEPEQVDYILLTHIHADHVGWNTRLENGRWVPTFPNATVICSDVEWRYGQALTNDDTKALRDIRQQAGIGEPIKVPVPGVFADSMQPLEPLNLISRVAIAGQEVLPGIRFMPTPGHSICHAAIQLSSQGENALFGGDVVHHPFEIYDPELTSMFCEFPTAAKASRRQLLSSVADTGALYFSSHFPASSVGKVHRLGTNFDWEFVESSVR